MLQTLVTKGRRKLEKSKEDSQALEFALSELQEQTDNASPRRSFRLSFMLRHGPSRRNNREDQDRTGFLLIIPLYRTLQKCSKTSEQFSAYWKMAA